jgi:hypothetical protein
MNLMNFAHELITPPEPTAQPIHRDDLRLSDLARVIETCGQADPGPDPTYDPEPIPDDVEQTSDDP